MIPHSVFLREEAVLPSDVRLCQTSISEGWGIVEALTAPDIEKAIRLAGWHFMCLLESYSRTGVGRTRDEAIHQALKRALKGLAVRFNAAELERVQVSSFSPFNVATITLQARHIQPECALCVDV